MSKEWPQRCPLPLEAIQQLLIQYLASGRGYDDASVAAALKEGNHFFEQKDFGRALDFFGIAYELGRLHFVYRPLLHDLLLRRILCLSLLGRFEHALQECQTAEWMIPHEATCQLLFGIVYSKLGRTEEANSYFQLAVAARADLRDLVDCLIAFFTKQHGFLDRAIRICTQVLKRSPRYPLAMLVRGDSQKCNQGCKTARHSATADYTALLELDFSYQAILCRQAPKPAHHTRADELLLSFHPTLQMQTPKPYDSYVLCRRRDPLAVASLVLLAVTKLRTLSTSGMVLRSVQQAYNELLEQRAQLQRKVYGLMLTQQRLASPLANQVYGPVDPEHACTRRYRRYWMEQTPRQRSARGPQAPEQASALSPSSAQRRQKAMLLAKQQVEGTRSSKLPPGPPDPAELRADLERRAAQQQLRSASAPDMRTGISASAPLDHSASPPSPASPVSVLPPRAPPPRAPGAASGAAWLEKGLGAGSRPEADASEPAKASSRFSAEGRSGHVPQQAEPELPEVPAPTSPAQPQQPPDLSRRPAPVQEHVPELIHAIPKVRLPTPVQQMRDIMSEASVCSSTSAIPSPRPIHGAEAAGRIGEGWDDSQWFTKAMDLLNTFSGGVCADLGGPFIFKPSEAAVSSAPGLESKLVQIMEEQGLGALPEWYHSSVDRITKVQGMAACTASVEPHAAARGLLGAPGRSYVVPKRPAFRDPEERPRSAQERPRSASNGTSGRGPARKASHERPEFGSGNASARPPPQARARKRLDPELLRRASVA